MEGIKVLHCADLHFDDEPGRLRNTVECCDRIVETARIELPQLIVIAGDVYERGLNPGFAGDARGDRFRVPVRQHRPRCHYERHADARCTQQHGGVQQTQHKASGLCDRPSPSGGPHKRGATQIRRGQRKHGEQAGTASRGILPAFGHEGGTDGDGPSFS